VFTDLDINGVFLFLSCPGGDLLNYLVLLLRFSFRQHQDEVSQEAVQQALATLIAESNATVVLVAHRLSTVVNADSICVIDKGTVLEQGNHEELVAKGDIYASMVEKQLKKKADLIDQDSDEAQKNKVAADDIDALLADK
jgi:ABC-type multidrug transport system ATPase subunit